MSENRGEEKDECQCHFRRSVWQKEKRTG